MFIVTLSVNMLHTLHYSVYIVSIISSIWSSTHAKSNAWHSLLL